ncbi:MAG: peptidase M64 [Bacteroidales bacterium]|nr:peptidase M64 [Bacteroidales bacterium]
MNCSMRIDYIQTANADSSLYALSQIKQEPYWGGSMNNLIDTFRYGTNVVEVYDSATNKLIYSRGYATLCSEWQKTKEAKSVCRSFEETVIVPFPKRAIRIEILSRDDLNQFHKVFEYRINPHSLSIIKDKCNIYITESIIKVAESQNAVDIVFIPDGYTLEEMAKFKMDAEIFAQSMLTWKPFEQYKNSFNFWAVNVPSAESGTDIPGENIWANTALNTTFNTFNSERYLSTQSIKNVRDAAGHVPYDQIVILVNSGIYGGGGIYNFYAILSADNENSEFVFCHEFGHSFAALADEYYDDETTYIDFYNLDIEPYQPNITTIVDFNLKWADLVDSLTPIPTPETPEFIDKIGVFEGGGYVQNGIYRPTYNSSMKSGVINNFGPVNERAIIQMIRFYIE